MTQRPHALKHYQQAIQALSNGAHSDLSDPERQQLIRRLRAEKRRLFRALCMPLPEQDRAIPRRASDSAATRE